MSKLALRGRLTFQTSRFDEPEPQFGSREYFRSPNRYGFFSANAELPWDLSMIATVDFTGPMLVPHYAGYIPEDRLERSRNFTVLNLMLSRTIRFKSNEKRSVRYFLKCSNLFDTYQSDLDKGPMRDAGYLYGPMNMREITGGFSISF